MVLKEEGIIQIMIIVMTMEVVDHQSMENIVTMIIEIEIIVVQNIEIIEVEIEIAKEIVQGIEGIVAEMTEIVTIETEKIVTEGKETEIL